MEDFYRQYWERHPDPHFAQPALEAELREHVNVLAVEIGERNYSHYGALAKTIEYIQSFWQGLGFEVHRQAYEADGKEFYNLWVELVGSERPEEVVVLGAHYDTVWTTPGADDNGSAVAGLLAVSRDWAERRPKRTVRFVAFANEEPPFFMSDGMGSLVYAESCARNGDNIVGMVCLEMLGYYCDVQDETLGLLPEHGRFIAFVGNTESELLVSSAAEAFVAEVSFPLQAAAVSPQLVPQASFSDHWSFWQHGYPAFMITDTGPMRNPHYHQPSDLPPTLDFASMTRVVHGVKGVLESLALPQVV